MRVLRLAALALCLEVLRISFLARMPAHPDFLLGMVVVLALSGRATTGAAAGLAVGTMRDLLYGTALGVEAAPLTAIGWVVGSLGRSVYREAPLTRGLVILLAGLAKGGLVYLILRGGSVEGLLGYGLRITLPSALMTAILVPWALSLRDRWGRRKKPVRAKGPAPQSNEAILLTER